MFDYSTRVYSLHSCTDCRSCAGHGALVSNMSATFDAFIAPCDEQTKHMLVMLRMHNSNAEGTSCQLFWDGEQILYMGWHHTIKVGMLPSNTCSMLLACLVTVSACIMQGCLHCCWCLLEHAYQHTPSAVHQEVPI